MSMNRQRLGDYYRNAGFFAELARGDWVSDYADGSPLEREAAVMVWLLEWPLVMCFLVLAAVLETAALPWRLLMERRRVTWL